MALAYGFNVSNAEKLTEDIASAYKSFGSNIKKEWEVVVTTLQNEWIGPDEQDFEKEFAKRVCKMYAQAQELVKKSIENIVDLTNTWIDFQNKNSLDGKGIGDVKKLSVNNVPALDEKIISHKARTFTEKDDMGLANTNSASKISKDVKEFATGLKKQSKDMFDAIESNKAFFGGQAKQISKYVEAVGETLGEITVAIADLDKALDTLAKSNYKTSDDNIESSLKTASSDIEKLQDDLGDTRWK